MNPKFILTFGIRYSTECHPSNRIVHPQGYVALIADSRDHALFMAHEIFDGHFAEVKEEWDFNSDNYPLGELARYVQREAFTEPDVVVTENGKIILRGSPRIWTPGDANVLAQQIQEAAGAAVAQVAAAAADAARIAEVGVKKHDDMF